MNVVFLAGSLVERSGASRVFVGSRLLSLEVSTATDAGTANVPVAWFDPPTIRTGLRASMSQCVVS